MAVLRDDRSAVPAVTRLVIAGCSVYNMQESGARSVRCVHHHTWIFLASSHLTPRNQAERLDETGLCLENRHNLG